MKAKKIITAAMCLCMAAQMSGYIQPVFNANANGDIFVEVEVKTQINGIYQYKNYGNCIEIVATASNATGVIEVPSEIDGLPVTTAGEHAFAGNQNITEVVLPSTLKYIERGAFQGDTALTTVKIPDGITTIKDETFLNCMSLTDVSLPDSLRTIGVRAFYNCAMESVRLPASVKKIGSQAFDSCRKLRNVNIPDGVTTLEEGVFSSCDSLTSIDLPESVEKIGQRALPSGVQRVIIWNPDCEIEAFSILGDRSKCTLIAQAGSKVQSQAEEYGFQFAELLPSFIAQGDANGDGDFGISDVVTLQNWLMGKGEIKNPQAVDYTGDGVIDVFDLCLMKQAIVKECVEINPPAPAGLICLTADIKSAEVEGKNADEDFINGQTKFALELFQNTVEENKNVLVSPYSVVQALAMTGNGADGITKEEMEDVIGGGIVFDELNKYLYTQRTTQPNDDKCKLLTANSVWTRDDEARIQVRSEFLQKVVDYYGAEIFKAPFDESTVNEINNWVDTNTDHMIPSIIEELSPDTVMCLINAVTFDAKWRSEYYKEDVVDYNFTAYDGTVQEAEMMMSDEYYYLEDENATGFYKYYQGGRYAFAALLPDEDITVVDYVKGLTPESLHNVLANPQIPYDSCIRAGLPKFSYDYDTQLSGVLTDMGMPNAFSGGANFSKMAKTATGTLFIDSVIHKTHIDVFEEGTRAAAVTGVFMNDCAVMLPEKEIILDRPFVYCIVDTETYLPVFMGTLMSLE